MIECIVEMLKENDPQPRVVREIVRCKDCRFRVLHQCNCEKKENVTYGMFTEDDFFCANGERRTEV